MNTLQAGGVLKMNRKDVDFSDGKFEVLIVKMPKSMTELSEILRDLARANTIRAGFL